MAFVTTQGAASVSIKPDSAVINLTLTHVAEGAAGALTTVGERSAVIEALLGELHVGADDWTTSGIGIAEEWQWRNDTNVLVGHRATVTLNVRLTELATIGALIGEATSRASAQVSGPTWSVDASNPRWDEVYADAARDARRRALAYAAALGLTLGRVESISETPLGEPTHGGGEPMLQMRTAKAAAGAEVVVNPGQIDLRATVYVRFALLAAD